MKASITKISGMVSVYLPGLMVENTKEDGTTENSTVSQKYLIPQPKLGEREYGITVNGENG
jgi:hypothetical protein